MDDLIDELSGTTIDEEQKVGLISFLFDYFSNKFLLFFQLGSYTKMQNY